LRQTNAHEPSLDAGAFCRLGFGPARWGTEKLTFKTRFLRKTHRQPMAVGFLFPVIGSQKIKPQSPMHTTFIDADAPRLGIPPEDVIPDLAFILGLVYLEAGLPPEAALRSALADYECSFSGAELEPV
jgi:hypothetical protein